MSLGYRYFLHIYILHTVLNSIVTDLCAHFDCPTQASKRWPLTAYQFEDNYKNQSRVRDIKALDCNAWPFNRPFLFTSLAVKRISHGGSTCLLYTSRCV